MKSNQKVKFIYLLQVFISIQLIIKVAWGASVWAKPQGQNYFTKVCLKLKTIQKTQKTAKRTFLTPMF